MKSHIEFLNKKNIKLNSRNSMNGNIITSFTYNYTNRYNTIPIALGTPYLKMGVNLIDILEILKQKKMGF